MDNTLPGLLPAFLPDRRWFGGKARLVAGAGVEDAAWLPDPRRRSVLVVAEVRYADGGGDRYSLVLVFDRQQPNLPIIGRVEGDGESLWAMEAASHPEPVMALLHGFSQASPMTDLPTLRGGLLQYRDADDVARTLGTGGESKRVEAVGADQSNTSLRVNRTLAFKLFRKVEDGENPELEIGRFLTTRTMFRAIPILRGSLTYVSASGASATLGVLQDWIDSQGDGWSHLLSQLGAPGGARGGSLLPDARLLGSTTADFHAALATGTSDPAFAPEPATPADVVDWQASVLERAARTLDLVERHCRRWPDRPRRLGEALIEAYEDSGRAMPAANLSAAFEKIRIHGDYHLGQTLKTSGGFVLIDFEGEPARPLAQRRAKQAALKDVAGMIRSFDYAIEAGMPVHQDPAERAALGWQLRTAFLEGYRSEVARIGASAIVPQDPGLFDAWVSFFEAEKALYEVEYEIAHRPAWVHIPLQGLTRIMARWRRKQEGR